MMPNNFIISRVNYKRGMLDIHSHVVDDTSGLYSRDVTSHNIPEEQKSEGLNYTLSET
jgi:hypothetical protein